jgi:hypothetical protein
LAAFFAGFLAAFFAGFLAAFLVAICLFSLFDGLHRFCNRYIAVEECIESRGIDVKKKTTREWKNKQQLFGPPPNPLSILCATNRELFSVSSRARC